MSTNGVSNNEEQQSSPRAHFSLELVAMVAVIAISSWHIGHYMSTFDGWLMAAIMGATLGFCNFLCAHNIFHAGSTSRLPSFVGLTFFAITSTWMQYTYFLQDAHIGTTVLYGINLDALALGIWAPAAEILLGWIYAANVKSSHSDVQSSSLGWSRLGEALVQRIEQRTDTVTQSEPGPGLAKHSPESTNSPLVTPLSVVASHPNNSAVQPNSALAVTSSDSHSPALTLSKAEALAQLLDLFAANPYLTYDQAAAKIDRSKTTIANYVSELKQQGKIAISKTQGVQVLPPTVDPARPSA